MRIRFLDALRAMYEGNLYFELGYSGYFQYCDRELGLARSTASEYVRAATAMDELPRLRAMFSQGELSWQQVRSITRVASSRSEVAWIDFALSEPVQDLHAEVREAQRTGRDAPRAQKHGLPNLLVRVSFDLTLEEKERVRAAFARVASGMGGDRNGTADWEEDGRPVLVRWADGILSGAIPAAPVATAGGASGHGRAERPTPSQTILYRTCPECRRTTLQTPDGMVSVDPARVAELAAVSNRVEISPEEERPAEKLPSGLIDQPNSARLARKVHHRDGLRCANPGCHRQKNLHAHHIVFRSKGGSTELSNEITICDMCHALVHAGLLEVSGDPDSGLKWRRSPKSPGERLRDAAALDERLRHLVTAAPRPGVTSASRGYVGWNEALTTAHASTAVDIPHGNLPEANRGHDDRSTAVDSPHDTPAGVDRGCDDRSTAVDIPHGNPAEVDRGHDDRSTAVDSPHDTPAGVDRGCDDRSTAVAEVDRGCDDRSTAVDPRPRDAAWIDREASALPSP